jgi:4-hydroxy-3-methylbut-2-enyl diphosphate reductase
MGEAPHAIQLVETTADVDRIDLPADAKVAYLTQTTLSVDDANRIIARLRQRFPQLANPPKDDICYATQNRQEAVRTIAPDATVCLVLGSQNSSNSQRLREIAAEMGVAAYLIDGPEELRPEWFRSDDVVLVTAGASAPENTVERCIEWLQSRFDATVEVRVVRQEDVKFPLPKPLRSLQPAGRSSGPRSN